MLYYLTLRQGEEMNSQLSHLYLHEDEWNELDWVIELWIIDSEPLFVTSPANTLWSERPSGSHWVRQKKQLDFGLQIFVLDIYGN